MPISALISLKKAALELVFPSYCSGCGEEGSFLCQKCSAGLRLAAPSCFACGKIVLASGRVAAGRTCKPCRKKTRIFAFLSPFFYKDEIPRELVHNLKYRRVREAAKILGGFMAEGAVKWRVVFPKNALLVPVPLHPARERMRGFNQAALIAESFRGNFAGDLILNLKILRRAKATRPQTNLSFSERKQNVCEAFVVYPEGAEAVKNKVVVLLDDVKTTGATLEQAAAALKSAGAKAVWTVAAAR